MTDSTHQAETNALHINGLAFRYPNTREWTVRVDSLALAPQDQLLLTGGSGCGKSTLLHLIAGLYDPSEGEVRVAGRRIHALRGADRDTFRGRTVGMIFQTFNLLSGFSAVENVMLAMMYSDLPKPTHRKRATELLATLGLDRPDAQPESLSIGQQQRVAVARAVACEPDLVLADEPSASLDPENAAGAMDLIQRVCREQGAALLCVSHDPAMADRFERRATFASLRPAGTEGTD